MSLETWKQEYYKQEARDVPREQALDHSILKWTGLLKKNLKKHNVFFDHGNIFGNIFGDDEFVISYESCALCMHYIHEAGCVNCPLARAAKMPDRNPRSWGPPYPCSVEFELHWQEKGNARPMLALLKKAWKEEDKI